MNLSSAPVNPLNNWYVASVQAPIIRPYKGWQPCVEWCRKHLGDFADSGWIFRGEGVFEFRSADDHMIFLLKWG